MDKVVKSDAEWRAMLPELAYKVTRKHATERAFTHDNFPKDAGTYICVCCGAPLFDQNTKFDSGTGWPSFYQPIDPEMVGEQEDRTLWMRRQWKTCEAHPSCGTRHSDTSFPCNTISPGARHRGYCARQLFD